MVTLVEYESTFECRHVKPSTLFDRLDAPRSSLPLQDDDDDDDDDDDEDEDDDVPPPKKAALGGGTSSISMLPYEFQHTRTRTSTRRALLRIFSLHRRFATLITNVRVVFVHRCCQTRPQTHPEEKIIRRRGGG